MKIGILGTGSVGIALAKGWIREGHTVRFGSRDPSSGGDRVYQVGKDVDCVPYKDAVAFADVVVLAVPYRGVKQAIDQAGAAGFKGKVVLDVTNPLGANGDWAVGFTTSAAEEIAKMAPGARLVKAFNHVFAQNMSLGRLGATKLAALVASDDAKAKETVMKLASDSGFEAVDAGPLKSARYMEAMAMQLITLGYGLKMGPEIGFSLARKRP